MVSIYKRLHFIDNKKQIINISIMKTISMAVAALLFTVEGSKLNSLKTPINLSQLSAEKPSILA